MSLIEAPGGFGKTTLAEQLAEVLGCGTVRLVVDGEADEAELQAELRRGLRAVGMSDAVSLLDGGVDLEEVFEAIGSRPEPVVVLVDEIQRLAPDAAALLARAVRGTPPGMRVVLAGRRCPPGLHRAVAVPDGASLDADDLRFSERDTAELLTATLGTDSVHLAGWLTDAVLGWPAAAALAVAYVQADPARSLTELGRGGLLIEDLIDDLVADLPATLRDDLPSLGALPLFDARLLAQVWGPDTQRQLVEAGLTIRSRADGWSTMPDPVRDALMARGAVDAAKLHTAAGLLAASGQLAAATQLLLDVSDLDGLAAVLADRHPHELTALGPARLAALLHRLGDGRVAAAPQLLLHAAIAAEARDDRLRQGWLERADVLTVDGHPVLRRAVQAERAIDALRFDDVQASIPLAEAVLATVGPDEVFTRARALLASGVAQVMTVDASERYRARPALLEASELFHVAGEPRHEAEALRRLGHSVDFHCGDWPSAVEILARSLSLLRAPDRDRAIALCYYGEVLDTVGRLEEAESTVREAAAIGQRLGDGRVTWIAAWTAALFAAHRGDAAELHRQVAEAERMTAELAEGDANMFEYRVTVADALSGLGETDAARAMLDRARPFAQEIDRTSAVQMVDARIESLGGDPVLGETLLDEIEGTPRAVPSQLWIRRLERAVACLRQGAPDRAASAAADAFRLAAEQGLPDLPQRIEPWMVAQLARVLPESANTAPPVRVGLLGRFSITDPTGDHTPPPGQPRALVALVAVCGGLRVDEAIDQLWPDVDLATGRSRLRNLLNRIRERSGPVLGRDGDLLVLGDRVDVDTVVFERLADAALRAEPVERVGLARHALAHWAGEPLPEQRYEAWAAGPRERLRRRHLSLLDVVIDDALLVGDLDDAIRHLEAAIEAEPLDEARHVQLVQALVRQGRRSVARRAVVDALRVVESLDVEPSDELAAWRDQLLA